MRRVHRFLTASLVVLLAALAVNAASAQAVRREESVLNALKRRTVMPASYRKMSIDEFINLETQDAGKIDALDVDSHDVVHGLGES